ncbi:MAG: hypothetical protein MR581_06005 [Lachnospiraceae bacterium]|nr:hypothetical protein [Lachnospiraceae bacterium]
MIVLNEQIDIPAPYEKLERWLDHFETEFVRWSPFHLECQLLDHSIAAGILKLVGVRFAHQWTAKEYLQFLEANGWKITMSRKMSARIALLYAECVKER